MSRLKRWWREIPPGYCGLFRKQVQECKMARTSAIPFLDLVAPHEELKEELSEVFRTALATAGFIGGPMVEGFERDFAKFSDVSYCVGVGSGTDALRLML